jgi:hypothetical protein
MAAARNTSNPKPKNADLVLYRLEQVETKVDALNVKLDTRENITKQDLIEFRTAILERFNEKNQAIQEDIDDLKEHKADKKDVNDLKGLVKSVGAVFSAIIVGLVVYYLTTGRT